jgi:Transposase DDE domain group 1
VRLIVRRQPRTAGEQFAIDDLDGWRLHAIITNIRSERMTAAAVEAHHRLRGGIPEDTIRALKNDYGMIHAPVGPFFGNWLYRQACALAHNVSLWLRTLALPRHVRRARGKRLRLAFLNVPARLARSGRRLHLRFAAAYAHVEGVHRRFTGGAGVARVRLRPHQPAHEVRPRPRPGAPPGRDHARPTTTRPPARQPFRRRRATDHPSERLRARRAAHRRHLDHEHWPATRQTEINTPGAPATKIRLKDQGLNALPLDGWSG